MNIRNKDLTKVPNEYSILAEERTMYETKLYDIIEKSILSDLREEIDRKDECGFGNEEKILSLN